MRLVIALLVSAGVIAAPATPAVPTAKASWAAMCDGELAVAASDDVAGPELVGNLAPLPLYRDAARYRKSGNDGAEACARAMREATDPAYRAYLGLVRSVHLIEARDFEAALAAAREVPQGALAQDRGFQRTIGSSARYLEAEALVRLGRVEEAEDAALDSALMAGMDVVASSRAILFARLTPRMTERKRRFIARLAGFNSAFLDDIAEIQAWAGDFAGAAESIAAMEAVMTVERQGNPAAFGAITATYAMLAGDLPRANAEAGRSRAALERVGARISPKTRNAIERMLDFVAMGAALAAGRGDEAQAMFARRSDWVSDSTTYYREPDWLELRPPAVIAMLRRFAGAGIAVSGVAGSPLALGPEGLAAETFRRRIAYIASPDRVSDILPSIQLWATEAAYRRAAALAWQVGESPRFLRREGGAEAISTLPDLTGITANDALLLHAALIARSRNKRGFALSPWRQIQGSTVRFGNPGDPGFPAQATLLADDVIAILAPLMPDPAGAGR